MRDWVWVILLTPLLCSCGESAGEPAPSTDASAYLAAAQLPELQEAATNACLCTRRRGIEAKAECWNDFDATVARYRHASEASACGPGSSAYLTFAIPAEGGADPFDTSSLTVMTEFPYGACSTAEIPALKTVHAREAGTSGC